MLYRMNENIEYNGCFYAGIGADACMLVGLGTFASTVLLFPPRSIRYNPLSRSQLGLGSCFCFIGQALCVKKFGLMGDASFAYVDFAVLLSMVNNEYYTPQEDQVTDTMR